VPLSLSRRREITFLLLQRGQEKPRHFPVPIPHPSDLKGYGSSFEGAGVSPAHATASLVPTLGSDGGSSGEGASARCGAIGGQGAARCRCGRGSRLLAVGHLMSALLLLRLLRRVSGSSRRGGGGRCRAVVAESGRGGRRGRGKPATADPPPCPPAGGGDLDATPHSSSAWSSRSAAERKGGAPRRVAGRASAAAGPRPPSSWRCAGRTCLAARLNRRRGAPGRAGGEREGRERRALPAASQGGISGERERNGGMGAGGGPVGKERRRV
jgi:hypothetical protein